jgi:RNA polymerase sigma-70 factor (ECF subfamily)
MELGPAEAGDRPGRIELRTMSLSNRSTVIQGWLDRLRAGNDAARAELLECAGDRLVRLARKMLKDFPKVRRWEQTDDVLQNAILRLHRALERTAPQTVRSFFHLAAFQIRRELIDMARHYYGPNGIGAHHKTQVPADGSHQPTPTAAMAADTDDPERLSAWTEFHHQVERLPEEQREVVDLLWYQGLTQGEAAEVLGVSEKTINRRWMAARVRLGTILAGQLPV